MILDDKKEIITGKIKEVIATHDAVLTSGGAWTGDRDFVAETLNTLGWKKLFHSIRIGPGKPVGFGMLNQKPVFILPGGPPSNLTAFLQIALPGLLRLGGHAVPALLRIMVKLERELICRHIDWTEFVYGQLILGEEHTLFKPLKLSSRLKSMARAEGVIAVPEGVKSLPAGAMVTAQVFI